MDHERCCIVAGNYSGVAVRPSNFAPCTAAFESEQGFFVSEDAAGDSRLSGTPSSRRNDTALGAYAGFALLSADGRPLGTLSVMTAKPRRFRDHELSALGTIARAVADRLELVELRVRESTRRRVDDPRLRALEDGTRELEAEIEQRKRAEERLRFAAYHDALTGLVNRAHLEAALDRCVAVAKGDRSRRACVLFIDLDRFKRINDRLGHGVGDQLLKLVAKRLERSVRPGDIVGRLGGDEFMVLLEDLGDVTEAEELAKRILTTLAAPYRLERIETYVTVSIGLALIDDASASPSDVLREADIAMYRAKEKGRNRVAVFRPYLRERDVAIATLESDLRVGWERREFFLAYQPIVSLPTNALVGFEALLRWNHPERGIVYPKDFIAGAEDIGLIVPLGEMVIGEASRQLYRWQHDSRGSLALTMSVNFSSLQLGSTDIVDHVDRAIKLAEIDPATFVVELTESAILDDFGIAADVLERLRALGVRIHMDDFGTGYSSLNYLRRLPIDRIKIDSVFVSGENGLRDPEIVDTIVSLAHKLGLAAIAEGVETEAQRLALVRLGCDAAQGFLYAPAVAPLEAGALLGGFDSGSVEAVRDLARAEHPGDAPVEAKKHVGDLLRRHDQRRDEAKRVLTRGIE